MNRNFLQRPLRSKTSWAPILAGAVIFFLMTCAIGRPTVMTDTQDYFAQGRSVVKAAVGWATQGQAPFSFERIREFRAHPRADNLDWRNDMNGGRSGYYSVLGYSLIKAGGLWLLTAAQDLVASAVLFGFLIVAAPGLTWFRWLATIATLALGTGLAIFCAFAGPDVFTGLAVLLTVLSSIYADRLSRSGRALVWGGLCAFLAFHASNLVIVAAVALVAGALQILSGLPVRRVLARAAPLASAWVVAMALGWTFAAGIWASTGDHLRSPPYLTARVLADGPGRKYLPAACAADPRLVLCGFKSLPLDDTEDILWSEDPARGVFDHLDSASHALMAQQQTRFVINSILTDPVGQIAASVRNWGLQLAAIGYQDVLLNQSWFLADDYWSRTDLANIIYGAGPCSDDPSACEFHLPIRPIWRIHTIVFLGSLTLVAVQLLANLRASRTPGGLSEDARLAAQAALILILAILINAAVCGMLSGPFTRYQARIVWLTPAAAILLQLVGVNLAGAWSQARGTSSRRTG